jgi:hypothetical protein
MAEVGGHGFQREDRRVEGVVVDVPAQHVEHGGDGTRATGAGLAVGIAHLLAMM